MARKALFIAPVYRLSFSSALGRGERFFDDMFVTNDREQVRSFVTPSLMAGIGGIETQALLEAEAVIYSQVGWPYDAPNTPVALETLNARLAKSLLLLHALWLVRDHAAGLELGFFVEPGTAKTPELIHSNTWSAFVTTSSGDHRMKVAFSRDDLHAARSFVTGLFMGDVARDVREAVEFHREAFRLTRALYFVQGARATRDLSVKVAHYCTALECLFANETGELTHRLGERLARFLESDLAQRKTVYSTVKRAYDVRSKTVHGARTTAKFEALEATASACDELIRRSLTKILSRPELHKLYLSNSSDNQEFADFLLELVLS